MSSEECATHPEAKSAAPNGGSCTRDTVGLLRRRPVESLGVTYIGKEPNRVEDVERGLVHQWRDVRETFRQPDGSQWADLLRI